MRCVQHVPRHAEVDQEDATALEPDNQILAAPLDRGDSLARELGRHLGRVFRTRQPRVVDLDAREAAADEHRLEPPADRLDLGQLGHPANLAPAVRAQPSTSRTSDRRGGASSPISYAARTSRTASAADASSRAWTSASISPAETASPRLRRQTTPTEWSISSSFVRRPAPRWRAASPIWTAPSRVT